MGAREGAARARCPQWQAPSLSSTRASSPPPPPFPQYSEKYYDDVFEYRCVAQGAGELVRQEGAPKSVHRPSERESCLPTSRVPFLTLHTHPQARRAAPGHCAAAAQRQTVERGACVARGKRRGCLLVCLPSVCADDAPPIERPVPRDRGADPPPRPRLTVGCSPARAWVRERATRIVQAEARGGAFLPTKTHRHERTPTAGPSRCFSLVIFTHHSSSSSPSHSPSGAASVSSSRVVGCTTPSTAPSRT